MMKNPEQTIGNIADKQKTVLIDSIDEQGFPNIKAIFQPHKREEIKVFINKILYSCLKNFR